MPGGGASITTGAALGKQSRDRRKSQQPGPTPQQIKENQQREAAQVEAKQQAEDDTLAKTQGLGPDFLSKQRIFRDSRDKFFEHQAEVNAADKDDNVQYREICDRYLAAKKNFEAAKAVKEEAEKEGLVGRAREGDQEAVRALLGKEGVDLNSRDSTQQSALTAALSNNDAKMVEILLAQDGIDVNSGMPPLHHAAQNGSTECIALLIKHKDISLDQKYDGKSAMQVAQSYDSKEHLAVVTQLREAGATEFSSSCCLLS